MLETKKIGNKIAEARKKMNLSQAQLAESLFISPQAVGKWERGESMPDILTFSRLAEILGVDMNYFVGRTEMEDTDVSGRKPEDLPSGKQKKMRSWDMSGGNWVEADFSGLKNLHEKFSSSNLQRCKFVGSDLSGLLLKGNQVVGCDFSGSDINDSHFQISHMTKNAFKDCSLKATEFLGSHLESCDFSGADFTATVFKACSCLKNTMANVVFNHTSFIASDLIDLVFEGTMEDGSFENCSFKGVTFKNATLINTFFKNRSLKRVRFIDCQVDRMTYEFLKNGKADLNGIRLMEQIAEH